MNETLQLPQSYASTLSFAPESMRSTVESLRSKQAERQAQAMQQVEQQKVAIEEQRLLKKAQFQEESKQIDRNLLGYPEVQHELDRRAALIDAEFDRKAAMFEAYGQPKDVAERMLKNKDKEIEERYGQALAPFEKLEQYSIGSKNWEQLRKQRNPIENLMSEIQKAQSIYNEGVEFEMKGMKDMSQQRYRESADFMKTFMLKTMNSVISADAVNLSEMLVRYPQLLSGPEVAQLEKSGMWNVRALTNKFLSAPKDEQLSFKDKILQKVMSPDPGTFLVNATRIANSLSDVHNNQIKNLVENVTSPATAEKWGANPFATLDEGIAGKRIKERSPQDLLIPISGGGYQAQPMQQAAPQAAPQQAAPAVDIDAIRKRYQSGYKQ
jgi:hypothetical protein